jgi:hypothetical protein
VLADAAVDQRWPEYSKNLAAAGARTVLGIPLALGQDACAALNFISPQTGLFTEDMIKEAAVFADMAGQALRSPFGSPPWICSPKTSKPQWSTGPLSICPAA